MDVDYFVESQFPNSDIGKFVNDIMSKIDNKSEIFSKLVKGE